MNAVIYARYSSHGQTEQSIEGQLRVCHEYAEREGLSVIGEYIDRAISGRSDDRPEFQRMISDAKKRQFQFVIVYRLDRFTRNRYDSAIYKYKLKQCGVKVLSAMENIGDSPEGIILEAVLEASAEYYSVELSQKIKRGRRESAIKGQFVGGTVPIGYKTIGKQLVIDEDTAPIIKYAFEQYALGVRKKDIIAELNARGIRNRHGKPLGYSSFQEALRNELYTGKLKLGEIVTEGGCPAIIDKETFNKVQERLVMNKKGGSGNKAKVEYLLSRKAFCGYCGAPLQGVSGRSRNGEHFHYYSCKERRINHTCKKMHEKKGYLEWYLVEQTVEYVLTPERIGIIAKAIVDQYEKDFNYKKIKDMERTILKLDREIDEAVDASIKAPSHARDRYYEKMDVLETQKRDLEIEVSKLKVAAKIHLTEEQLVIWLKHFCRGEELDEEFQTRIIDTFINTVFVYDDKIVIYYNIKGGKQVSYIDMLDSLEEAGITLDDENDEGGSYTKGNGGA